MKKTLINVYTHTNTILTEYEHLKAFASKIDLEFDLASVFCFNFNSESVSTWHFETKTRPSEEAIRIIKNCEKIFETIASSQGSSSEWGCFLLGFLFGMGWSHWNYTATVLFDEIGNMDLWDWHICIYIYKYISYIYIYTDLTGILETWFARLKNYLGVVGLKGIFACDLKDYSSRIVISKTDPSEDLGQHVAVHGYTAGRKLKQYLKINQWKVSGI